MKIVRALLLLFGLASCAHAVKVKATEETSLPATNGTEVSVTVRIAYFRPNGGRWPYLTPTAKELA